MCTDTFSQDASRLSVEEQRLPAASGNHDAVAHAIQNRTEHLGLLLQARFTFTQCLAGRDSFGHIARDADESGGPSHSSYRLAPWSRT